MSDTWWIIIAVFAAGCVGGLTNAAIAGELQLPHKDPEAKVFRAVFAAGCVGGLTNAAIAGELQLPHKDPEAKVFRPGWIGNVLVGGVAALVFWGLYGPMAAAVVIGPKDAAATAAVLRVSELFGALLTGIGGGRLLTAAVDKRIAELEKAALTQAKDSLGDAVKKLAQEVTK